METSIISELAYELLPFVKVYKDGKIERLMGTDIVAAGTDPQTGVESKDVLVLPHTGVSARIYKPKSVTQNCKIPLVMYFHGGGFYVQTPFSSTYQPFLHSLVAESNIIVVSVDYRRAPEFPLPIGYQDSWDTIKWVLSHANSDGPEIWINEYANLQRVFIAGDSAGGNIAHNMAIRVGLDKPSGATFEGLILMHPYFWGKDPIGLESSDMEKRGVIEKYWNLACPGTIGADDPLMNPKMDLNLWRLGCNRVLVFAAENDFLRSRTCWRNLQPICWTEGSRRLLQGTRRLVTTVRDTAGHSTILQTELEPVDCLCQPVEFSDAVQNTKNKLKDEEKTKNSY